MTPRAVGLLRDSALQKEQLLVNYITADMVLREEQGRQRYGVYLSTYNGRDALIDCYEELLDAFVYATQHNMEEERTDEDCSRDGYSPIISRALIGVASALAERRKETQGFLFHAAPQPAPEGGHDG